MLANLRNAALLIVALGIHFSVLAQTPRATLYVTVKKRQGRNPQRLRGKYC